MQYNGAEHNMFYFSGLTSYDGDRNSALTCPLGIT